MVAPKNYEDLTEEEIRSALNFIDPNLPRKEWARIGMAIKAELGADGFSLFDEWSQDGRGYNKKDARDTWKSIHATGGINIGTLIFEALKNGFRLSEKRAPLPPDLIAARKKKREDKALKEAMELARKQAKAEALANEVWEAAEPANDNHPYPASKRVSALGLKVGAWPLINDDGEVFKRIPDALLIPVKNIKTGKITSLQGMYLGDDGKIVKRYLRDGRKKLGAYRIGKVPEPGDIVALCEGYATGQTINRLTGWTVIVCFDAPNVPEVAKIVRESFPQSPLIVCADNDAWTDGNPGVESATRAAKSANALAMVPKFKAETIQAVLSEGHEKGPSDYNDLANLEGYDEARAQLLKNPITERQTALVEVTRAANDNVDYYSPLIHINSKGKPLSTIENTQEICQRLGITVRYNVITKEDEILIPGESFSLDNQANASYSWLESELAKFNMPTEKLAGFVTYLADKNLYNPVANWITSKPWDGKPRLKALFDTVTPKEAKLLPDGRKLSDVLILRWVISAVAAAFCPTGVSAHGILVMQGPQYLGKTFWFKQLVPESLGVLQDGMTLKPDDRDSVKQILSFWLVELGELDATFRKSDIAALKAFIPRSKDTLRRAYARKESSYARRTVFFGSVNPREFLNDPTGNRRYWTIECAAIDLEGQAQLDMQQVWAEALVLYRQGEPYRLTPDEIAALNQHNENFMSIDPIEERLQTKLCWESLDNLWEWKTATEILLKIGVERPTQAEATKCASLMRKMNGEKAKRSHGKNLLLCPPSMKDGLNDRPF